MRQFAVIGLGRFGYKVSEVLASKGAQVIAIDKNSELVEKNGEFTEKEIKKLPAPDYILGAKDILVVVGDSKDIEVLEKHTS